MVYGKAIFYTASITSTPLQVRLVTLRTVSEVIAFNWPRNYDRDMKVQDDRGALAVPVVMMLLVIVSAAAIFGMYIWQHKQVTDLESKVSTLTSQISVLSKQPNKTCPQPSAPCPSYTYMSAKGATLWLFSPSKNGGVTSPVAVIGEVPGNWSFEAEFPVRLMNNNGTVVAQASAHVLGDWQTDRLVPFSAQLTYSAAQSGLGTLILEKDSPSDLPQNADSLSVPVSFK